MTFIKNAETNFVHNQTGKITKSLVNHSSFLSTLLEIYALFLSHVKPIYLNPLEVKCEKEVYFSAYLSI